MPDSVAQIDRWRQVRSEDENIEFKEAKKQIHFDDVCRYCVAIANEGGGHFVLGMTNSPPRQVVGSAAIENPVKTANQIFQKLKFRVNIKSVAHHNGRVVILEIPSRPVGTAYHFDGAYLMRSGSSLVSMSEDRLRSIFLEGQPNWLEQPTLRGASVRDVLDLLDTQTFFKLLTLPYPTRSGGVIEKLIGMRLIEGGRDDVMRHDLLP